MSIGHAFHPEDGADALLAAADRRVYLRKQELQARSSETMALGLQRMPETMGPAGDPSQRAQP